MSGKIEQAPNLLDGENGRLLTSGSPKTSCSTKPWIADPAIASVVPTIASSAGHSRA